VPSKVIRRRVAVQREQKNTNMNTAHTTPTKKPAGTATPTHTLEQEADELQTLHTGLVRHLAAWRDAHESAIMRLGATMARIDAIVERIERTGA
jgi:hypothetical protein